MADERARAATAAAWGVDRLPDTVGRDTEAILAAARAGELQALLVGGVELADLPDPAAALAAVQAAPFVVSLELRESDITQRADVVFPVAPAVEKTGSYLNWEGRRRRFEAALRTNAIPDSRVLNFLADEVGVDLGLPTADAADADRARLGLWSGQRVAAPQISPEPARPHAGQVVLAGWRMLLDAGRLQDGEPHLAGTARPAVARLSAATASDVGVAAGEPVTVSTERGAVTLPVEITDMVDGVVWLPVNSAGSAVHATLGVIVGQPVAIARVTQ